MKHINTIGFTRAHSCEIFKFEEKQKPQEQAIIKYCNSNAINLIHLIKFDTTGQSKDGGCYWLSELKKILENTPIKIDCIMFQFWDRLGRNSNSSEFQNFLCFCRTNKIKLLCTQNQM